MEIIFETLLETEWGLITFGVIIIIAIFINFFSNKPKT